MRDVNSGFALVTTIHLAGPYTRIHKHKLVLYFAMVEDTNEAPPLVLQSNGFSL